MMGSQPTPWMFTLSQELATSFILISLAGLLFVILALVVTIRSQGGAFLYLNVGAFIVMIACNLILIDAANRALSAPMELVANR
jgi:hypothetical protein